MPFEATTTETDFEPRFADFVEARREQEADVGDVVRDILRDVRARGDAALLEYTTRFDRLTLTPETVRVPAADLAAAEAQVPAPVMEALRLAAGRIEAFHARQMPLPVSRLTDEVGVELGSRWTPVDAVGLYVPGGRAAYPSSLLMNAIPARVAGVPRIAMTVPAPDGHIEPLVLAAARLAGVDEVYRVGGAQAIAALAYGTATIAPVDKIVGPGNAYVAEAKRQVFGRVGIDMIAGPSEIVVVSDGDTDASLIAADLLSQAEHDPAAQAVLITPDAAHGRAVATAVEAHLTTLPRAAVAGASWRDHGAILIVRDLAEAADLVNRLAPEHLELAVADPDALMERIRHVGTVFLGRHTPEPIGDYVAGTNHVLPTSRSARFSSGLNVLDFVKRTTIVRCSPEGLRAIGPAAVTLANAEGLRGHARAVALRLNMPETGADAAE